MNKLKMVLDATFIALGVFGTVILTVFSLIGLFIALIVGAAWRRNTCFTLQ